MENMIKKAIENKRLLKFEYNGKNRTVEPHTLGLADTGNVLLSAFQTQGGSNSGKDLGWRQFIITNILNCKISEEVFFEARPDYNPNNQNMIKIYVTI